MKILEPKDLIREIQKITKEASKLIVDNFVMINKIREAGAKNNLEEVNKNIKKQKEIEGKIFELLQKKLALIGVLNKRGYIKKDKN